MADLRKARIKAGFKRAYDAAEKIGIHGMTLYRYENGELSPTLETLERMATVYGLKSLDELVGRVPAFQSPDGEAPAA